MIKSGRAKLSKTKSHPSIMSFLQFLKGVLFNHQYITVILTSRVASNYRHPVLSNEIMMIMIWASAFN